MVVRIHDSLARRVVDLEPAQPPRVSMYVCGPTVYDVPHVGHGRTALVFDVVRRYLEYVGYDVHHVVNVTDVDDRIIERAALRGSSEPELATEFEAAYWAELDRLGVLRPHAAPHATGFIAQMQALVAELLDAKKAYVVEGQGVYFAVESYDGYGELAHRSVADLVAGAGSRVEVDERKRSPVDFALWKAAKPGEPSWDSPWGPGRPGWHIECAAMSLDVLGPGFDLHGGGDDLVFPHHENERAEAEAAGHPFARRWMHSGMVVVDGEKMSKSLGNFTTLADALDGHGPRPFRLLALQTKYRRQMEINASHLEAAAGGVERLDALARRARSAALPTATADAHAVATFRAAMEDDFDTPAALAAVFDAVKAAHGALDAGDANRAAALVAAIRELTDALGLELDDGTGADLADDGATIDALVEQRAAARAGGDYAAADRIRAELAGRGVTLEDTATGTVWHR